MSQIPAVLGPDGRPVVRAPAQPKSRAYGGGAFTAWNRAYEGASFANPDVRNWLPNNWSPSSAYAPDQSLLTARIHDLARNDGWVSSGLTKKLDNLIGARWMLSATPNYQSLGITVDQAVEWAQHVEALWYDFAEDPDCWIDGGRNKTFGELLAQAMRHKFIDGDAFGAILYDPRRAGPCKTFISVTHPARLSNPWGKVDSDVLKQGVQIGPYGEPEGYYVRGAHPGDYVQTNFTRDFHWDFWPRETDFGRRLVFHSFDNVEAGQVRGVSVLAPLVLKLRKMGRYDDAELQAAILNAVMAAIIETPFDQEQMANAMSGGGEGISNYIEQKLEYYGAAPLDVGGAKVGFTFPGEKVTLTKPAHPNAVYEHYMRAGLRNVASVMGVSYEQLSMDWSQSNYSSARAAIIEVYRGLTAERDRFASHVAQPIYAAWLEEKIDDGTIKMPPGAPSFYAAKSAWTAAEWIGPARGWVDPIKEAEAAVVRIAGGLSTLKRECSEQGLDYRKVIVQRAREIKELQAAGLDPTSMQNLAAQVKGNIGDGKKPGADDGSGQAKDGAPPSGGSGQ